jgi:hypothetical protein
MVIIATYTQGDEILEFHGKVQEETDTDYGIYWFDGPFIKGIPNYWFAKSNTNYREMEFFGL